jgi:XTP/dITP diphosphohydrolase
MKKELVFASHNRHKAIEIQHLLGERYLVKTLSDIGCEEEIAETGQTLSENASLKSWYIYNKYGVNCFADDTGLEVEALNGAPGVFSARYAGMQKNDQDNIQLLLHNMYMSGQINRSARFRTVISCIIEGQETLIEGILEGNITQVPKGTNGFGYDPIFQPQNEISTLAEMTLEQKSAISHRAQAIQKLISFLKDQY